MKSFSLNKHPKNLKLIILLAIIAIIPLTVLAVQQQQEIRQRASSTEPDPWGPGCPARGGEDIEHNYAFNNTLTKNWSFDNFTSGNPNDWTIFKEGDVSVDENHGEGIESPVSNVQINGKGSFKAGVYQTVSGLTAGNWYHAFYATAQRSWGVDGIAGRQYPDRASAILREIGIDQTAGNDPNSTTVTWGRSAGGPDDKIHDSWRTLGQTDPKLYSPLLSFKATSNKVTLFVRAKGYDNVINSETWIDYVFIVPTCDTSFTGITITSTPTPIQQSSSACRKNTANLIKNCDFEEPINLSNATGPDWRNTGIDPERGAGPGQYTNDLAVIQTADNGKAAQIGRENDTCSLPKTGGGGTDDLFRVFAEIKQNTDVSNANRFHLSFDVQMKSKHSRENSAPFYVWSGFNDHISDGKEVFLAYTPHIEAGDSYCSESFQSDYDCRTGFQGPTAGCNDIFNPWKRVTVDFTRSQLCGNCTDQRIFVGFGVSNNYDTLVKIDNIELTAEGAGGPIYPPNPTASPTPILRSTPTPTLSRNATPTPQGGRPTFTPTPTFTPGYRPTPTPIKARSAAGRIPIACPTLPFTQGMQIGCFLFVTPTPR